MKKFALLFGLASILVPQGAQGAQGGEATCDIVKNFNVSAADAGRMARLEVSRAKGLAGALETENSSERALIASLFKNDFEEISNPDQLIGDYKCRTIKMGGGLPSITYGWFACEVFPEEAALIIRKNSGSQRFFGLLFPAGNGMAYRGALGYGYETELKYYGGDEKRNQVGCLSAVGPDMDHFILEMPEPVFESEHNVIELVRTR